MTDTEAAFPLLAIIALCQLVLFFWALADLLKRRFEDSGTKVIWGLVIFFIPLIGPFIYLFTTSDRSEGKHPPSIASTRPVKRIRR